MSKDVSGAYYSIMPELWKITMIHSFRQIEINFSNKCMLHRPTVMQRQTEVTAYF